MKLNTNIVLVGNNGATLPYVIELTPKTDDDVFDFQWGINKSISYLFKNGGNDLYKNSNDWYVDLKSSTTSYNIQTANIRLYFPQYSADTFENNLLYILNVSTYIHGVDVELGSFLFKRSDSLACPVRVFDGSDEYYEYIDFTIADPYSLHYEDECVDLRTELGEPIGINNTGSLLHFSLSIVTNEDDQTYIKQEGWTGGQNSVLIYDPEDLSLHIDFNTEEQKLKLHASYNKTFDNIKEYFSETYNCPSPYVLYQWVVMDKDNIYYEQTSDMLELVSDDFVFDINGDFFNTWDNFISGIYIKSSMTFFSSPDDIDSSFMMVFSNNMIISQELFSKIVNRNIGNLPRKIDFDNLTDMNNINLKAVNKIIQNITTVTPTDSAKNHLIQPVFYQTKDLGNVTIHPAVTENVAINLDSYKSQVSRFKIQIEGVVFNEIGRTKKGILFKVVGNMLPKSENSGSLFVLNQDNELVTSGKYNYVF